jgi:hypothetical protein
VTKQNYFHFDQQYYKQSDGLAMESSTSAILAETYIQHTERKQNVVYGLYLFPSCLLQHACPSDLPWFDHPKSI